VAIAVRDSLRRTLVTTGAYLLTGLQFYEHLHHQLHAFSQKIAVNIQFMFAQQFFQGHSYIGHLVLLFCCFVRTFREAQMTIFVKPIYTTL
jgi:hypothetical protein